MFLGREKSLGTQTVATNSGIDTENIASVHTESVLAHFGLDPESDERLACMLSVCFCAGMNGNPHSKQHARDCRELFLRDATPDCPEPTPADIERRRSHFDGLLGQLNDLFD